MQSLIRFGLEKSSAYDPLVIRVVWQSVQGFNQAVCRVQLNNTPIYGQLAIVPKPRLRCLLVACVWLMVIANIL